MNLQREKSKGKQKGNSVIFILFSPFSSICNFQGFLMVYLLPYFSLNLREALKNKEHNTHRQIQALSSIALRSLSLARDHIFTPFIRLPPFLVKSTMSASPTIIVAQHCEAAAQRYSYTLPLKNTQIVPSFSYTEYSYGQQQCKSISTCLASKNKLQGSSSEQ